MAEHACCEDAKELIRFIGAEWVWVMMNGRRGEVRDGPHLVGIEFCPFCGESLSVDNCESCSPEFFGEPTCKPGAWTDCGDLPQYILDARSAKEDIRELHAEAREKREELEQAFIDEYGNDPEYGEFCRFQRTCNSRLKGYYDEIALLKGLAFRLPDLIEALSGLGAAWRRIPYGVQFRFPDGAVLSWWSNGSTHWSGKHPTFKKGSIMNALSEPRRKHRRTPFASRL